MTGLRAELLIQVIKWCMQKVTAKQPGTRKNAAVLARDIAAVWTGLRGAIMVDYMPLPCDSMCAILESLIEDTTDRPDLVVLHLNSCLYLVHRGMLKKSCYSLSCSSEAGPFWVTATRGGEPRLTQAPPEAIKEVCRQLANMCQQILSCKPEPGGNIPFCDLDIVEDIPIIPTLSGWLLQYPVVYLADAQTASKLASLLSDATLELYQVLISGTVIQALQQSMNGTLDLDILYAFTVPLQFQQAAHEAITRFRSVHAPQQQDRQGQSAGLWASANIVSRCLAPHRVQI